MSRGERFAVKDGQGVLERSEINSPFNFSNQFFRNTHALGRFTWFLGISEWDGCVDF